jgi:naphthoate synthase
MAVSELFDPTRWVDVDGFTDLTDITYHHDTSGRIARVAFPRCATRFGPTPSTSSRGRSTTPG